jgi:hypothetical protein
MSRSTQVQQNIMAIIANVVTHLNNRPVSQWIGVRHTQLNHI